MKQTECSETSAYKIQMPGNYPEENIELTFPFKSCGLCFMSSNQMMGWA